MKKLVVVVLVLGICLPAGGALLVDGPVEWDIVGDHLIGTGTRVEPYAAMFSLADYSDPSALIVRGSLHGCIGIPGACGYGVMPEAGNKGKLQDFGGVAWDMGADQLFAEGVPASQFPGVWFFFDIVGEGEIVLTDTEWRTIGTIYVPEPVSFVLLGLGGVLLRRRK